MTDPKDKIIRVDIQNRQDRADNENVNLNGLLSHIKLSPKISEYATSMSEVILTEVNSRIDSSIRRKHWLKVSAIAASILIVLGLTNYISYHSGYNNRNNQLVKLENPLGIRTTVDLSDGSKVILNAGSELIYPLVFVSSERIVEVHGEAFFEVCHDVNHPFIVKAENIKVKVLGTKFNVKAYKDENEIEVTLSEGKVCVNLNDSREDFINLDPGQQLRFDKVKKAFAKWEVYPDHYISWRSGKFYFEGMTFQSIAKQLERNFNVNIEISSDDLKNTVFTGDFVRGENLEQILSVMTFDKRIKYKIEGNQVYINKK